MSALARIKPGNPYLRGWLSPVDLLELTSLVAFDMPTLFTFLTKQPTLMKRSTIPSVPLQLVFPDKTQ